MGMGYNFNSVVRKHSLKTVRESAMQIWRQEGGQRTEFKAERKSAKAVRQKCARKVPGTARRQERLKQCEWGTVKDSQRGKGDGVRTQEQAVSGQAGHDKDFGFYFQ